MRRPKLLPQSDVEELVKFMGYLADLRRVNADQLSKEKFYGEYREYLGLSYAELADILKAEASND